jgi:hypothetical protein
VQGDTNCDEGSCDRCGEDVSAIGDEDIADEKEDEFGKRVAVEVSLPETMVVVLCAAKDETSVEFMGRMFCGNFLRKS